MRRILTGLFSLLGFTAVMLISPAWAACVGTGCGCTALAVPGWSGLPSNSIASNPPPPVTPLPPWYSVPEPTITPEKYVAACAKTITDCVPSAVVLGTEAPPAGVSSWSAFDSLTPPSGYRTSNGCYGYGTGPCNATVTAATSPNAASGVTNYNYKTAFPCNMSSGGTALAGSDAGSIKQFRMNKNESISFSFTVPPMGVLDPTTTDTSGNPIVPIYRSISFNDWNNPFSVTPVKFVTISKTSGDFDVVKAAARDPCYQSGVMGEIKYSIVDSSLTSSNTLYLPSDVCPLEAGATYYLNVRFEDPTDPYKTQTTVSTGSTAAVDAAQKTLQSAQTALNTALGITTSDPKVLAAQDNLMTVMADTSAVTDAKKALDAALASGDQASIDAAQAAYNKASNDHATAVATAQAQLDAAIAAAPKTAPASDAVIAARQQDVVDARKAYEAAVAAYDATITTKVTFIQDTCEWSLCSSDKMYSNVGTPMVDTYSNAYPKEWQCKHDMLAYYTTLKDFCAMVASGSGPVGCVTTIDTTTCYPYTPVDPNSCVGNRSATVTPVTTWVGGIDGYETTTYDYSYSYTGGTPIRDCGVSIDMGCGLSVP